MTSSANLTVTLRLGLNDALYRAIEARPGMMSDVRHRVRDAIHALMSSLGIPGEAQVEISPQPQGQHSINPLMRLHANGELLPYSDYLLGLVYAYLSDQHPDPDLNADGMCERLIQFVGQESAGKLAPGEFLAMLCVEAVKQRPAILLSEDSLERFITELSQQGAVATELPAQQWLRDVLSIVLNLRLSIADRRMVWNAISNAADRTAQDTAEQLVSALKAPSVEIRLPIAYLRELSSFDPTNQQTLFTFLRDGLFTELGVEFPDFRIVTDEYLHSRTFAFKINALITTPCVGLRVDECLVNDSITALSRSNIQARPAVVPASHFPGAVTSLDHRSHLEQERFTTWDCMGYLALCMAESLRQCTACFVDQTTVKKSLKTLRAVLPALVQTVEARFSDECIARTLRMLSAEQISIRNMRLILERMLDEEYMHNQIGWVVALNEYPAEQRLSKCANATAETAWNAFVRSGLRRQISAKYARGKDTLYVFEISERLENLLCREENLGTYAESILGAIYIELESWQWPFWQPVILTSQPVRERLQALVAQAFPKLGVICNEDRDPTLSIQYMAWISLDD